MEIKKEILKFYLIKELNDDTIIIEGFKIKGDYIDVVYKIDSSKTNWYYLDFKIIKISDYIDFLKEVRKLKINNILN